jgi:peptide/nickel transport system ATP-binding protein
MTTPLLSVRGLSVRYGTMTAASDISFDIARGEVIGLVGESGSGKTSIGRAVLRLVPPAGGAVEFDGADIVGMPSRQLRTLRQRAQYLFQDPFASLSPRMSVREILREGLDINRLGNTAEREARVREALAAVEMDADALDRYPHEFSGGQRQRICIARALALRPDFIVADEPVSALDLSIQAQIINLLAGLRDRMGLTMLFISHDLAVVEYLCDRVIVLYLGRIMEVAPAATLYATPGHPYTQALLSAIPDPDPDRPSQRQILVGELPSPANPPSGCVFRTRCRHAVDRCAEMVPPLREVAPGHFHACWREDIPAF